MKWIRKFLHLSWADRWLLIEAFFLLIAIQGGLYFLPFVNLKRILNQFIDWQIRLPFIARPQAQRIPWAVRVASILMPNATCLPQALAVHFLLLRNGYAAELKIGAAKNNAGVLEAHAWVTHEEQIVIGALRDLDRYIPLSIGQRKAEQRYDG